MTKWVGMFLTLTLQLPGKGKQSAVTLSLSNWIGTPSMLKLGVEVCYNTNDLFNAYDCRKQYNGKKYNGLLVVISSLKTSCSCSFNELFIQ